MSRPGLSLETLQSLARVLGRSIGEGYAKAVLEAEQANAVEPPLTKAQALLFSVARLFPAWLLEASKVPRAKESAQAQLFHRVREYLGAVMEEGDEEQQEHP